MTAKLIKRTAVRKNFRSGMKDCSRLFALITSKLYTNNEGVTKASTIIELTGGRLDRKGKVRWTDTAKEFTIHEEQVLEGAWDADGYALTWHSVAVDLMASMTENTLVVDITAMQDYY